MEGDAKAQKFLLSGETKPVMRKIGPEQAIRFERGAFEKRRPQTNNRDKMRDISMARLSENRESRTTMTKNIM